MPSTEIVIVYVLALCIKCISVPIARVSLTAFDKYNVLLTPLEPTVQNLLA